MTQTMNQQPTPIHDQIVGHVIQRQNSGVLSEPDDQPVRVIDIELACRVDAVFSVSVELGH
jgi:hypothetical protein